MRKAIKLGAAFLAIIALESSAASETTVLAGRWVVRWDGNPLNENALSLSFNGLRVSGTYVNDAKEQCTVTGTANDKTNEFALTIVCPKWDIRIQGTLAPDSRTASGSYQAYTNAHGLFTMRKSL
jgi:hypothetical protein